MHYGTLFMLVLAGTTCGILHGVVSQSHTPTQAIRATFVPRNRRDFWLPPCPFCWLARSALACMAVLAVRDFWSLLA